MSGVPHSWTTRKDICLGCLPVRTFMVWQRLKSMCSARTGSAQSSLQLAMVTTQEEQPSSTRWLSSFNSSALYYSQSFKWPWPDSSHLDTHSSIISEKERHRWRYGYSRWRSQITHTTSLALWSPYFERQRRGTSVVTSVWSVNSLAFGTNCRRKTSMASSRSSSATCYHILKLYSTVVSTPSSTTSWFHLLTAANTRAKSSSMGAKTPWKSSSCGKAV